MPIFLGERPDELTQRAERGDPPKRVRAEALAALAAMRPVTEPESIAVPLLVGDRVLGGLALHLPGTAELEDEQLSFVGALANQAALAIDKASLYELERRTAEGLRELDRARSDFVSAATPAGRTSPSPPAAWPPSPR